MSATTNEPFAGAAASGYLARIESLAAQYFVEKLRSDVEVDEGAYLRRARELGESLQASLIPSHARLAAAEATWRGAVANRTEALNAAAAHGEREPHRIRIFARRSWLNAKRGIDGVVDRTEQEVVASYTVMLGERGGFSQAVESNVLAIAAREASTSGWGDVRGEIVAISDAAQALSSKAMFDHFVSTNASGQVDLALTRSGGATIGLAGPRGAGKTELASRFTEVEGRIGVKTWAPSSGDVQDYLRWLLRRLCEQVVSSQRDSAERAVRAWRPTFVWPRRLVLALVVIGVLVGASLVLGSTTGYDIRDSKRDLGILILCSSIAVGVVGLRWVSAVRRYEVLETGRPDPRMIANLLAEEILTRLDYTEKVSVGAEVGADLGALSGKLHGGRERETRLLTGLDLVHEFQRLVAAIATTGVRLVILIDELDKLSSEDAAIAFLNGIKVLFPVQGCSFIVSVSDNAWVRYARRGMPFRDGFDSSFDEVIRVDPLTMEQTRELLRRRARAFSFSQAAFVHALSGGSPRDALRTARHVDRVAKATDGSFLGVVAQVLDTELHEKITAATLRLNHISDPGHHAEAAVRRLRLLLNPAARTPVLRRLVGDVSAPVRPTPGAQTTVPASTSEALEISRIERETVVYALFLTALGSVFSETWELTPTLSDSDRTTAVQMLARSRNEMMLDPDQALTTIAAAPTGIAW